MIVSICVLSYFIYYLCDIDFVKLHRELVNQDSTESGSIPTFYIPSLPQKYTTNKYMSTMDIVVNYRKKELQLFLNKLIAYNKKEANHHG